MASGTNVLSDATEDSKSGVVSPRRIGLIIGQAPPAPAEKLPEGYQPLQGAPETRLARLAGYSSPRELWAVFDRVDLIGWCPGSKDRKDYHASSSGYRKHRCDGHRFPMCDARLAASRLMTFGHLDRSYALVVLCGHLVARAFGLKCPSVPWNEEVNGIRFVVLPHPSGVSHFWNDEVAWHRAAGTFRAALSAACSAPPSSCMTNKSMEATHSRRIRKPSGSVDSRRIRKSCRSELLSSRQVGSAPLVQSRFFERLGGQLSSCESGDIVGKEQDS